MAANWSMHRPMALIAPLPEAEPPPFVVREPDEPGRLVFCSPHSGDHYPADLGAAPLPEASLRSAEDAFMDRLIAPGAQAGAALLLARYGRAYLDLNRAPEELDPQLLEEGETLEGSPRAAAGYGVAPRLTGDGRPLYDRRLSRREVEARIEHVHRPYHQALARLMERARALHGSAVLIDWHSMPARATGPKGAQIVLGDRHGSACASALTRRLRDLFEAQGYRVALNKPYAGGYTTQAWGRPSEGFHALQVEISRGLYLDQPTLSPGLGWPRLEKALARVIQTLGREVEALAGSS